MSEHLENEQIHAFLDGELELTEQRQLQHHLEQCQGCRAELQRAEVLFKAIESVPASRLERDLASSVVSELERSQQASSRLPLWLAAQGLVAAGVVTAWLILQPGRVTVVGGLLDQIDLLFWWSQWALPRVSDLRLALTELMDQAAGWLAAMDASGLWEPAVGWPWVPILVGLLLLWLVSNSLLLRLARGGSQ